ncbi:MAG: carboxypeptidase-like regulatory domain-containing protein [bacterium]
MRSRSCTVVISALGLFTACGPTPENSNGNANNTAADAQVIDGPRLTGVVNGPSQAFPVQGALVAAFSSPPPAIPDHVYCEACVDLPAAVPNTLSGDDGSFTLPVLPGATYYLTVQKGQFRRVRQLTVPLGDGPHLVDPEYTTLPSRSDPSLGDTIPSIAVASGSYDAMETIFGKVGIGAVDENDAFRCDSAEGVFDVYANGGHCQGPDFAELLDDLSAMLQYHIIFVPCSEASYALTDPSVRQNIRDYTWAGGKWYVADWSYDMVEQVWPEFLEFTAGSSACDQTVLGDCNHGPSFDSDGHAVDDDLRSWLSAQGITDDDLILRENWDTIGSLGQGKVGEHPDTGDVYQPPHVWVEGPWRSGTSWRTGPNYPLTVSWPFNCGRVLFTSYHSVGEMGATHAGLYPQEKILFYLVMEIGVCSTGPIVR